MNKSYKLSTVISLLALGVFLVGQTGCTTDLTLQIEGQGSVTADPPGTITTATEVSQTISYNSGDQVTLTAMAGSGWSFDHWGGALSGSTNPVSLTMDGSRDVTAVFVSGEPNEALPTACDNPTEWAQTTISTDTTIPAGCYLARESITVRDGATLTLSPGVKFEFADGVGMYVSSDGALSAAGTAASPILLTGQNRIRGSWYGLEFDDSNSANNVLAYVTIEYGAGRGEYFSSDLAIRGTTRAAITNCTLRQSNQTGLWLSETATITAFSSNTMTQNKQAGVSLDVSQIGVLTTDSSYTGNDEDYIWVSGGNTNKDQTWSALGVPYLIFDTFTVDHHTTLAPGVELVFQNDLGIYVNSAGSLTAQGTATSPILLTATDHTPGYWYGLEFDDSNSANNVLAYVTIEYGAGRGEYFSSDLAIRGTTRAAITNCTLRQSNQTGLWLSETATITAFSSNTMTQNKQAGVSLDVSQIGVLTTDSSYTGNDEDYIWVSGGNTNKDQTWSALGVPYLIFDTFTVDHHTTLAPGVELVFQNDLGIYVNSAGSLTAQGTATSPILLTATDHTPGYWYGLEFDDSNSANNVLAYVTIEYGAGRGEYFSSDLAIRGTTRAAITNCTLRQSEGWGCWISKNAVASDIASANTFADNTSGNVYVES